MTAAAELRALLDRVTAQLRSAGVASPAHDARRLLELVAGVPLSRAGGFDDRATARLEAVVARRVAREPLQLIEGSAGFRSVEVTCEPGVFVPRPETEIVAGIAIDRARRSDRPLVVEPCTGTGAIACAVVDEVDRVEVVATDRSERAVGLAARNLDRVVADRRSRAPATAGRGEVRLGDLLAPVPEAWRREIDVVVANPPYLPTADRHVVAAEVRDDPADALYGGADGLDVVRRLVVAAVDWLRPGGALVVEVDPRNAGAAVGVARAAGLVDVAVRRDLTGTDRVLVATRPQRVGRRVAAAGRP